VLTQQFLAKYEIAVISHPPHSTDLAPCDFFIFTKMKFNQKGHRFEKIEEIQAESLRVLDTYRKGFSGSGPKIEEVEPVFTCGWGGGVASRVMAADRPYVEFYEFYSVSRQYFEYTLLLRKVTASNDIAMSLLIPNNSSCLYHLTAFYQSATLSSPSMSDSVQCMDL
jgi:hypothetical protein